MTDRELLLDIRNMLSKVCSYIDKIESPEYEQKRNERSFNINVAADLYVKSINKLRNER